MISREGRLATRAPFPGWAGLQPSPKRFDAAHTAYSDSSDEALTPVGSIPMEYDPYCRYPAAAEAFVQAAGLRGPIGCVIRNISEGGALVTLHRPVQLPKRIFLALRKGAEPVECEVRWRSSNRLFGLRFRPNNKVEALEALLHECAASGEEQHRREPRSRTT